MNDSTLCIGADIHLKEIVLRGVDKASGQEVLKRFRVTNNLPGAESAVTIIHQAATSLGYTHIEIAWEATGMLWLPFHRFLATNPFLLPFAPDLVCFNLKLVAKFKEGLDLRGRKDDEHDAYDVAARLRFGELGTKGQGPSPMSLEPPVSIFSLDSPPLNCATCPTTNSLTSSLVAAADTSMTLMPLLEPSSRPCALLTPLSLNLMR